MPYVGWCRLAYKGETINIDSLGIRNPNVSEKSLNFAFLGGFSIWGTGVNHSNTIPSLFNTLSRGKYQPTNYGETGYRAYQGYQFLQLRLISR